MWNYMKSRDVFVRSNREGVEKVMRENYAYLMESRLNFLKFIKILVHLNTKFNKIVI